MSLAGGRPEGHAGRWPDLLLVLLLTGGGLWLWLGRPAVAGARAVVRLEGRTLAWWPLEGPVARDTVAGRLGPVVVEHGSAGVRIVAAPCPNRLCLRQGAVRHVHDRLVCLPSALTVTVEGDAGKEALDALQ